MRVVVAGGGATGRAIAEALISEGHEVVIIEKDKAVADALASELDCSVIHGDAASPETIREAGVEHADAVVAATGSDRDNIVAALVARHLGAKNVIVVLEDDTYADALQALGVDKVIIPQKLAAIQTIALLFEEVSLNLSDLLRHGARFFIVPAGEELDGLKASDLTIEGVSLVAGIYRGKEFVIPTKDTQIKKGDEILIVTKEGMLADVLKKLSELTKRGQG